MEILKVENLKKIYGSGEASVEALKGVSFSMRRGEFGAVVGVSGSGKSTLLNCIGGLDKADSGRVLINDKDIFAMGENERTIFRRQNIGFIFQSFHLIPELDVEQNIIFPLLLDYRKPEKERVEEMLQVLGLENRRRHLPGQLSGGQQQRVAIGRALIMRPALVLADEPTGSVKLVQHYPKIIPVTFPALSTFISSMADRQRVRFSSRDRVSYIALKSAVKYFLTAAKSGGDSCAGSGSCPSAAVYIS